MPGIYDTGLDRNIANHQPLTPLSFLERAATYFAGCEQRSRTRIGYPQGR